MIVSVRSEAGIKEWSTPRRRCRTKAVICEEEVEQCQEAKAADHGDRADGMKCL
jgi:hypothetical protein